MYVPGRGAVVPPGPALIWHSNILGVGCGLGEGVAEGLGFGVGVGVAVGRGDEVGVGVGVEVGVTVGRGVTVGVGQLVGVGIGVAVGHGVGVVVGVGFGVELGVGVAVGQGNGVGVGVGPYRIDKVVWVGNGKEVVANVCSKGIAETKVNSIQIADAIKMIRIEVQRSKSVILFFPVCVGVATSPFKQKNAELTVKH